MNITSINNKDLKRRILEISYKHGLSHVGSCLTSVDIIEEIYETKALDEKFILSAGHAGLALYAVLEKHTGRDAEKTWAHHGVHPDRCATCGIDCSSGSLGNGLPIALGMALADRTKNVYCLISDGEAAEGSIWEALRISREQKLYNLYVYINCNGWGAYKSIDVDKILKPLDDGDEFVKNVWLTFTDVNYLPFLNSPTPQQAHYHVMSEEDYKQAMEILK